MRGFLQSSFPGMHAPDKVCGMLASVSLSDSCCCCWLLFVKVSAPASAATQNMAADAATATAAVANIRNEDVQIADADDGSLLELIFPVFTCPLFWHIVLDE
ncbi:hypothetical protein ACH5RR_019984 [Cinchona calisaya]|uniref:Uncharacterized protein n=1 Tax=Cinchona calisaya TaxID=153742 RepID=A0ABD2ZGJ8_9GENT